MYMNVMNNIFIPGVQSYTFSPVWAKFLILKQLETGILKNWAQCLKRQCSDLRNPVFRKLPCIYFVLNEQVKIKYAHNEFQSFS